MGFPGTWMTESESVVYRVVPKCACSTIGQIMFYSDHGRFFDGDIHDSTAGLHKWSQPESQPLIEGNVRAHKSFAFTCVRNPYARILSSFFDKIAGIQRNGKRYRGNLVPQLAQRYGVQVGSPENGFDFDQIASFRRFLLFARDTIRWRRPMEPDIHWSAMSGHISTFIVNGGRYDHIFFTEKFNEGMQTVLDAIQTPHPVDLARSRGSMKAKATAPSAPIPFRPISTICHAIWSGKSTRRISSCSAMISTIRTTNTRWARLIWMRCMPSWPPEAA